MNPYAELAAWLLEAGAYAPCSIVFTKDYGRNRIVPVSDLSQNIAYEETDLYWARFGVDHNN